MYDDVDLSKIPRDAAVVAGYVGGKWPTFSKLPAEFPHAAHLSIAVNALENAETLDIERGDAEPQQAPSWMRRQLARGVKRPVVYCSVSDARKVVEMLGLSGIPRRKFRLWTAHYTDVPHLCSKRCGYGSISADATQFTHTALGRELDESLVSDTFFVHSAPKRAALRAWILARHAHGWTWAQLKKTSQWKLWRRQGGK